MFHYPGECDPQQRRPCAMCEICRCEIYMTDPIYYVENCVICPDCVEEFAIEYFGCRLTTVEEILKGGDGFDA